MYYRTERISTNIRQTKITLNCKENVEEELMNENSLPFSVSSAHFPVNGNPSCSQMPTERVGEKG